MVVSSAAAALITPKNMATPEDDGALPLTHGERLLWIERENGVWWPALSYEHYGQALEELSSQLDQRTKSYLTLQFLQLRHTKVAHLLVTSDFVVLDDKTKTLDFYAHLAKFCNLPELEQPMRVVQDLLEQDVTRGPSNDDKKMSAFASAPAGATSHVPVVTVVAARKEASVAAGDLSVEPDDTWHQVWHKMRRIGWKLKVSSNSRKQYWMSPGASRSTGENGKDYFTSLEALQTFVQQQYGWNKGQDEDAMQTKKAGRFNKNKRRRGQEEEDDGRIWGRATKDLEPVSTPENQRTHPQDPGEPLLSSDEEEVCYDWNPLWKRLKKDGWVAVRATRYNKLHDWYYLRPDCSVDDGELGRDFFSSTTDVIEYMQSKEQPSRKRARMSVEAEEQVENDSSPKKRSRAKAPSKTKQEMVAAIDTKPAPAKTKKDWWFHTDLLPSFRDVWSILQHKLHFRYSNGMYKLPYGDEVFPTDLAMRCHLVQHGIPNLDLATAEDRIVLERWVTFCNVPVKHTNSVIILADMQEWSNEEASTVLEKELGFHKEANGSYHRGDQSWESLQDVRLFLRGAKSLAPSAQGRRRKQSDIGISGDNILGLRLWAALDKTPLPKFPSPPSSVKKDAAVVETTTEKKATILDEETVDGGDEKSGSVVCGTPDDASPTSSEDNNKTTSANEDAMTEKTSVIEDTTIEQESAKEPRTTDKQNASIDLSDDESSDQQDARRVTMDPGDIVPMTQPMM